ncbi:MAG: magnesium/cobalt transporter CorA [Planctomycetes bacterium]|nr:magnesium/cobalt transporter CorA [Planctomycetota bacterium]
MNEAPQPAPAGDSSGKRSRRRRRRPPIGASPGMLQPEPGAMPAAMWAFAYGPDGIVERKAITLAEIPALRAKWPCLWLDIAGFGDVETLRGLGEMFGLHRLALEDVANLQQRAKAEDYGDHEFLVLRMVDPENQQETEQLGLFVGKNFVLTFQERPGDCFGLVRNRLQDPSGQMRKRGSDYLAYALLDAVVDAYFPVVEKTDLRLAEIEENVLAGRALDRVVPELHSVRRCMLALRRAIWPLREATSTLVRGEVKHFSAEVWPYLRDVHDHVVQLLDLLENSHEMSSSLMDLHLSTANNRLNEVIKLLTIISTIFIPLTFLVGVYGMNFKHMPELEYWWGYPACLALMVAIVLMMLRWFRKRGWL